MIARLLRILAATMPAGVRERYREEWAADAAGAAELGRRPAEVLLGALATAVSIDRADPRASGLDVRSLALRRGRWGAALVGSGLLVAMLCFLAAGRSEGMPWLAAAEGAATALALAAGIAGLGFLASAIVLVLPGSGRSAMLAVALCLVLGAVGLLVIGPVLLVAMLVLGSAVGVPLAVVLALRPRAAAEAERPIATALVALGGALAVLGTTALGLLHVFVWNPLAKVPGLPLEAIYARLEAAGELGAPLAPGLWAAGAVLSVLAILATSTLPLRRLRASRSPRRAAIAGLGALSATAFGVWMAGFTMGMGLADTFMTDGGDAAPTGLVLALLGAATGIPALWLALTPGPVMPRPAPTSA
ncbi:hypothetical protein [Homoserinibacter sp. YIM 151385]|uniref:hypothetical protein n=1 Tax=Homoserinibacter sp. YIM 151385 TaxID=2985506 RepID=UPI0022F11F75|nr:hypothetical protein [Homoserinibacter sp. YIM 151385]WBU38075.1 hypothetical protein OF852_00385 [Homoserinibacter sp. YIM 151385]